MYTRILITTALICSLITALACADTYDPNGEYWYGHIGADVTTADPYAECGEMTATPSLWTVSYTDDQGVFDTMQLTDITTHFDAEGWYIIQGTEEGSPWVQQVAANDHIIHQVSRDIDEDDLSQTLLIRKDFTLTDADVVGEYALAGHWLDVSTPGASVETGTVILDPDHTFDCLWQDSSGDSGDESGTWALDGPNSQLLIDPVGDNSPFSVELGQGGLVMDFDIDPLDGDDLGYNFLVKKTSGRIASEAVGHYLVQAFYTNEAGYPWTAWGTADVFADGTYVVDITNSDGTPFTITGSATMDDDGTIHCTDDILGQTRDGIISLDGDLIVLPEMEYPSITLTNIYLVRPAPEPLSLALLILGSVPLLLSGRKRRSR